MPTPVKVAFRWSSFVIIAMAVQAGPLMAQMPASPDRHFLRIGFAGGVVVPTSRAADVLENGIGGQAFVLIDPGLGFPLRFNLGYQKFDYKEALQSASSQATLLSGTAGTNITLLRIGPLRPYVSAGLGAFRLDDQGGDDGTDATARVRFGIDGGGGLALKLGRLEAFIEGRVQNVYTDQGAIDRSDIRAIPVSFGILF